MVMLLLFKMSISSFPSLVHAQETSVTYVDGEPSEPSEEDNTAGEQSDEEKGAGGAADNSEIERTEGAHVLRNPNVVHSGDAELGLSAEATNAQLSQQIDELEQELARMQRILADKKKTVDEGDEAAAQRQHLRERLSELEEAAAQLRLLLLEPQTEQVNGEPGGFGTEQATDEEEGTELTQAELKELEEALQGDAKDSQEDSQSVGPTLAPGALSLGQFGPMNPAMSVILDVAFSWFNQEEPLQTGAHDPAQSGFTLQQLEIHLESNVDQVFRMDANLVFSLFGVEVEEAFATTLALPYGLQVRAGQFFTRFGRINPTHPHSWDFGDQPIMNGKFLGAEGSRGLGLELSWLAPLPWYAEFIFSANRATGECCARSFYGRDSVPFTDARDVMAMAALRQFLDLGSWGGIMGGLSVLTGPNASGIGNRTEIYGADLHVRWRPVDASRRWSLTWQSEMMHRRRQIPNGVMVDNGLYSQVIYQHNLNWDYGARIEWVSGVDDDPLDPDWGRERVRGSLQATYRPSHFSRIRLQTQTAYRDIPWDTATWSNEYSQMSQKGTIGVMLMLEVLIGAHGAHNY